MNWSEEGGALVALLAAALAAVAVVAAARRLPQRSADRDRLGVRQQGRHGAVRRAGARRRPGPGQAGERQGRRQGRPLKIVTCDTQGNKPAIAKACAAKLLGQGADIIFTTCDVDFAAPGRAGGDQRGQARGRAVHRHRSDGPEAVRRRRAGSRSRSATSPRTRARRWRSTRGPRDGGPRRSRPTP